MDLSQATNRRAVRDPDARGLGSLQAVDLNTFPVVIIPHAEIPLPPA